MEETHFENLNVGESVRPIRGVVVERRCFLTMTAMALAAVAVPGSAVSQMPRRRGELISFDEFLEEVVPVAKQLVSDTSLVGQDRYLLTLASFAIRLEDVPRPGEWRDSKQSTGPGTFIGFNPGGDPFVVLHWRMEPGTIIRTHAHTYGNVVTLGLEGAIRIQNFEMLGKRDFDIQGTFKVRKTQEQILTPGRVNLVSLEHDYIHGFTAGPNGARGLDITTRIKEKRPTPYLALGSRAVEPALEIYEASWTT